MSRYKRYKESYQAYAKTHRAEIRELQYQWAKRNRESCREYDKKNRKTISVSQRKWRKNNPEKKRTHNLISHNPQKYPLESSCAFCGETKRLEHGHIDYDFPEIYLTVCRRCNIWMGKGVD